MVLGDVEGLKTKRGADGELHFPREMMRSVLGMNQNWNVVRDYWNVNVKKKGYIPRRRKVCWRYGGRRAGTCADRWTRRWHWRGHGVGNEEPRTVACSLGLAIGKQFPQCVILASPITETNDQLMTFPTIGILDDFQSRQLVGVAGVGTSQIPRAILHTDAEDGDILVVLGDAKAVGGGELAIDQIHHTFVVAVVSTKLEVTLGVVAVSSLNDAELPTILAQDFVGIEADRIADPHYLEGAAVGTVDVGARPRLVVGIATAVGIVGVVRIVVVWDLLIVFVLTTLFLVFLAILLLVLNVGESERHGRKKLVCDEILAMNEKSEKKFMC